MNEPCKITIGRLALEIPGFDPAQAILLADRVARHLAPMTAPAHDVAIPRLSVVLHAPNTGVEQIAAAIARAIRERAK